jgi:aryl-alcohol dehydrogenase-like predicted oxidoreductase
LTGKYTGSESFADFRGNHPDFTGERFQKLCRQVQQLRPIAEKYDLTICQLVLAATLMHPAIHVAVCGVKTPEQIAESAMAMGKTVSRGDYFAVRNTLVEPTKLPDAQGTRK